MTTALDRTREIERSNNGTQTATTRDRTQEIEEQKRSNNCIQWLYVKQLFRAGDMDHLIRYAEDKGFTSATYVDGRERENVKVLFVNKEEDTALKHIFDRITAAANKFALLFEVDVYPEILSSIQIARYLTGDHYEVHIDHDTSMSNLEYDRKLSVFVSCSPNGALEIEGQHINVGKGDAIVFSSMSHHAAPVQGEGSRYSFVAWITGPRWR